MTASEKKTKGLALCHAGSLANLLCFCRRLREDSFIQQQIDLRIALCAAPRYFQRM
jgi:hypothetical protein